MNFYGIRQRKNADIQMRVSLLKHACEARKINYVDLDSEAIDYSAIPQPQRHDFLYNIGRGSQVLESLMLNKEVTTFYKSFPKVNSNLANTTTLWTLIHEKENLPSPKTIHSLSRDRSLLDNYVEYLGGFPVIIKAIGGTRGVGVIKVESAASLYSIADHLVSLGGNYILRQFIESAATARLVVLGNQVVASVEYIIPNGDFRSNIAGIPNAKPIKLSAGVEETAIKAVDAIDVECGGVDLILDKEGNHYLLEVNYPFSFLTPQFITGTDIAGMMVDYLIEKQRGADEIHLRGRH